MVWLFNSNAETSLVKCWISTVLSTCYTQQLRVIYIYIYKKNQYNWLLTTPWELGKKKTSATWLLINTNTTLKVSGRRLENKWIHWFMPNADVLLLSVPSLILNWFFCSVATVLPPANTHAKPHLPRVNVSMGEGGGGEESRPRIGEYWPLM